MSRTTSLEEYLTLFKQVAREIYRVFKPIGVLGILVGDTRIRRRYVPITHYALMVLLDVGFVLKEEVIEIQHKMKTTREVWSKLKNRDFLPIYHEKLFVLEKPRRKDPDLKYSTKPWFVELKI